MDVNSNTLIIDVLRQKPKSSRIIQKYFAGACFSCPSFQMETIAEGAIRHGQDPQRIVDEINEM